MSGEGPAVLTAGGSSREWIPSPLPPPPTGSTPPLHTTSFHNEMRHHHPPWTVTKNSRIICATRKLIERTVYQKVDHRWLEIKALRTIREFEQARYRNLSDAEIREYREFFHKDNVTHPPNLSSLNTKMSPRSSPPPLGQFPPRPSRPQFTEPQSPQSPPPVFSLPPAVTSCPTPSSALMVQQLTSTLSAALSSSLHSLQQEQQQHPRPPQHPHNPGMTSTPIDHRQPGMTSTPIDPHQPGMTSTPIDHRQPGMTSTPIDPHQPGMTSTPIDHRQPGMTSTPIDHRQPGMTSTPIDHLHLGNGSALLSSPLDPVDSPDVSATAAAEGIKSEDDDEKVKNEEGGEESSPQPPTSEAPTNEKLPDATNDKLPEDAQHNLKLLSDWIAQLIEQNALSFPEKDPVEGENQFIQTKRSSSFPSSRKRRGITGGSSSDQIKDEGEDSSDVDGVTKGVSYITTSRTWRASCFIDGKLRSRSYSAKKYGYRLARALAVMCRELMDTNPNYEEELQEKEMKLIERKYARLPPVVGDAPPRKGGKRRRIYSSPIESPERLGQESLVASPTSPPRSGVPGVYFHQQSSSWIARWRENGKSLTKYFSVGRLGYQTALNDAITFRQKVSQDGRRGRRKSPNGSPSSLRNISPPAPSEDRTTSATLNSAHQRLIAATLAMSPTPFLAPHPGTEASRWLATSLRETDVDEESIDGPQQEEVREEMTISEEDPSFVEENHTQVEEKDTFEAARINDPTLRPQDPSMPTVFAS